MYEPLAGTSIYQAVRDLKQELKDKQMNNQTIKFNGILLSVAVDSNVDDIVTIYHLKCELKRLK